jgi:peptidylprolyl isomerase
MLNRRRAGVARTCCSIGLAVVSLLHARVLIAQQAGAQKTEITSTGLIITAPSDVAAPGPDAETMPSGVAMKVLKPGNGTDHPAANDCVIVSFIAWKTDGALFSTSTTMNNSDVICLRAAILGVSEALNHMVVGQKNRVWIPEDLTFHEGHHHAQRRPEDEEPPHKDLTFDLELLSILKAPATPAELEHSPGNAVQTPSGLAFQILKNGTGSRHPLLTDTVVLHFSGWTTDGALFESTAINNHPASLRVGTAMAGLREALTHMVVGQTARFWIPAGLAYGEKPANRFNPSGNLVYDVELLAVQ